MIDVAVIASIPHLHQLSALGTVDMALTHLVLTNDTYADYYRQRAEAGITVILDNSAYELEEMTGQGMDVTAVLRAAARIHATVVICQDVLYDGARTVAATRHFLAEAASSSHRLMAVPQGATHAEWLDCYDILAAMPGIDMIGLSKLSVPRCFAGPVAETRIACVAEILTRANTPLLPLHLLGGDRSLPWELAEHLRLGHDTAVTSNDSSFAYWYPACGIPIDAQTGRASREAPTKPELGDRYLDDQALTDARRTARLLLNRAGADTATERAAA